MRTGSESCFPKPHPGSERVETGWRAAWFCQQSPGHLTPWGLSHRLMYKCSCEMIFNKKRHMQQHFYQNASQAQVGVFKCPECPLLFLQKPELMQHVKVGGLGGGG